MKRSELLQAVKSTIIGIDKSGSPTGMDFIIFDENWVRGFNDELSISYPIITGIKGAVKAYELLKVLEKMEGENLRVSKEEDGKLLIKNAKTTLKMTQMEEDQLIQLQKQIISLNTDKIEWKPLPGGFMSGLKICLFAAGVAPELGVLAGVSFSDNRILSTDNQRITIFTMEGDISEPFILPTAVVNGLRQFSEEFSGIDVTEAWIHFKGIDGGVVSVRKLLGEYPVEKIIDLFESNFPKDKKGKVYTLPDGVERAIDRAEVLASSDNGGVDQLIITLKRMDKHLIVGGTKDAGEIEDKVLWEEGSNFPEDLEIKVSPIFLRKIISITKTFQLSPNSTTILFDGKSFKHMMVCKIGE